MCKWTFNIVNIVKSIKAFENVDVTASKLTSSCSILFGEFL